MGPRHRQLHRSAAARRRLGPSMADLLSKRQRSELMARIRGRNTSPERVVRGIIRHAGFKYRLHAAKLPGSPDIVVESARTVIFVHGCFWHRHSCPRGVSCPATRTEFWQTKFAQNIRRDRRTARALRRMGWSVIVVWECQTASANRLRLSSRLHRILLVRSSMSRRFDDRGLHRTPPRADPQRASAAREWSR